MKTIFFDIDGTIIDCPRGMSNPSEKTKYAFDQLIKNGHKPIIASGRMKTMLTNSINELHTSGYLLCNGGYMEIDGKVQLMPISEDRVTSLMRICEENNSIYYLETGYEAFTNGLETKLHQKYLEGWEDHTDYIDIEKRSMRPIVMMSFACNDDVEGEKISDKLKGILDVRRQMPEYAYYDVNDYGTNKGKAIKLFIEYNNISKDDCYAFGDSNNDIEMMKAVGHGYAMGNACQELKEIADEVIDDVLRDGVYYQLVKLGLISPMK